MFHCAEPDEAGFGVMISTPGLTRSSQVWMLSGLPLRTTKTTTEDVAMPLVGVSFQSAATSPASTRRVTSGSREKWTTSASRPPSTARLWSPEAPYDVLNVDVLAGVGLLEVLEDGLVGRLEDREADDADACSSELQLPLAEHAVKASTPATEAATAALILMFIVFSFPPAHEGVISSMSEASRLRFKVRIVDQVSSVSPDHCPSAEIGSRRWSAAIVEGRTAGSTRPNWNGRSSRWPTASEPPTARRRK